MSATDSVHVSTVLSVDPATAFEIFTEEIDEWWKRGMRYRVAPDRGGRLRLEPRVGGRFLESYGDEGGESFELGRIRVWKPPECLVFDMGGRDVEPELRSEVEVRFEAVAEGTRVSVHQRGFDAYPEDHPVRHGLVGEAFTSMMGLWWADLLVALRRHSSGRRGEDS